MELSRDAIIAIRDLQTEKVDVPEWGGFLYARGLTAHERSKLEKSMVNRRGQPDMAGLDELRARLVVAGSVNAAGERLFTDADVPTIGGKSIQAVERIANVVARLSSLSPADVEDLAKNSEGSLSVDSPTD